MLANDGGDFEVVVADNSDSPEYLPSLLRDHGLDNDPRLKLLPSSAGRVYSMRENWERAWLATEGEWIGYIGDDDYVDPKATVLLKKINPSYSTVDYVRWDRPVFDWPDNRSQFTTIKISLINEIRKLSPQKTQISILNMNGGQSHVDGFSPYHAFTRRKLIDKVVKSQGGKYFAHPMVDYVTGYKQAFMSEAAIYSFRPLSVVGASKPSNSAAVRDADAALKAVDKFLREAQEDERSFLLFRYYNQFYERHRQAPGIAASIFLSLLDFLDSTENLNLSNDSPINLIKLVAKECEDHHDQRHFQMSVDANRLFLADFISQDNLKMFNPEFRMKPKEKVYIGLHENYLYVANDFTNARSAGEFYSEMEKMICPIERLGVNSKIVG